MRIRTRYASVGCTRRLARAAVFAALGAVLAACGNAPTGTSESGGGTTDSTQPTASTSTPAPSGEAPCAAGQVEISLIHSFALAGTQGGYLKFTNISGVRCRFSGWPTVEAMRGDGSREFAIRSSSVMGAPDNLGHPVVDTSPGESAYAVVSGSGNPGPSATACPQPFKSLGVTVPNGAPAATISAWLPYANSYFPSCTVPEVSVLFSAGLLPTG